MVNLGMEDGVHIDPDQIHEILIIPAGNRIHGLVGVGHGVEEGFQGAFHQFHEGLLYRIPVRAAQHRVLQNMEHTSVILRQGAEGDGKGLVLILAVQPDQARAAFIMLHADHVGFQLRQVPGFHQGEAVGVFF